MYTTFPHRLHFLPTLPLSSILFNGFLIYRAGHLAKSEDLHGDRTLYELRRQYHCMAYNMLVAVITCTQSKIQFYTGFLFKEEPLKVGGREFKTTPIS